MRERFVAVTQLELADPAQPGKRLAPPRLVSLVLRQDGRIDRLDMAYPGSGSPAHTGTFVTSTLCDLDDDGVAQLIYAVTPTAGRCYLLEYRYAAETWHAVPICRVSDDVTIIRSIAAGDVDQDGEKEIVLGTRPNGAIVVIDRRRGEWNAAVIDHDQYGRGTTNTREVTIADIDGDGRLEVIVATARADEQKWEPIPGAILMYAHADGRWHKTLIDDHGGSTHSRMVAVADPKRPGVPLVISCTVGTLNASFDRVLSEPRLRAYKIDRCGIEAETLDTLSKMIKSRSFAAGDIDHDGRKELVVGTRAVEVQGLGETALYVYKYRGEAAAWQRETLDASGPLGFHCVAIGDVDGDGLDEVVASDDQRGQIKMYKRGANGWATTVLYDAGVEVFCAALHVGEL